MNGCKNNINVSHWYGKTWYAYGTSLTGEYRGRYAKYVAEISGLICVNKGIGGGGIIDNRKIYDAVMSEDGKASADLITLEVGANDGKAPLGLPTDTDDTTFCGSLNQCIKYLLENCPKAQIVIMDSTRQRYKLDEPENLSKLNAVLPGGYNYIERAEAIRQCCIINGVYFIPLSQLGLGLYRMQNNKNYLVDHVHHSELGGYNLAQGIWAYLKNIPLWYNELPK